MECLTMLLLGTTTSLELLTELSEAIAGLASAVTAVFEGWPQHGKTSDAGITGDISRPSLWLPAAVVFIAAIALVRHSRLKRSKLVRPEAIQLVRKRPDHLAGRDDDVERLVDACLESPLVFLDGESGAGKSALILAGLLPRLRENPAYLPIYLDSWGQDWELGPSWALGSALCKALDDGQKARLRAAAAPTPEAPSDFIDRILEQFGRIPVLVFDQFDDYQARHRDRFLPKARQTWLPWQELIEKNSFWFTIRDLLARGKIRIVFVTRSDYRGGLESVRFLEPVSWHLDRLKSDALLPLLDRLTTPTAGQGAIVEHPDNGWNRLKLRMASDQDRGGFILPQRVKMALAGLQSLSDGILTVGAYEKAGGLSGLEALFIESHIESIARRKGLPETTVRAVLLGLLDPHDPDKTIPTPAADLLDAAAKKNVSEEQLQEVLTELAAVEIVRRKCDPETGLDLWQLDHDDLVRGIVAAKRREHPRQPALQEAADVPREAGRRIIPSYAPGSVVRALLLLAFIAVSAIGWVAFTRWSDARHAVGLVDQLDFSPSSLQGGDVDLLWKLAENHNTVIRESIFSELFKDSKLAARLANHSPSFVRAMFGLDESRARAYAEQLVTRQLGSLKDPSSVRMAALLLIELPLPVEMPPQAFTALTAKISETTDRDTLNALRDSLLTVAGKLGPEALGKAFEDLSHQFETATSVAVVSALAPVLNLLAGRLDSHRAGVEFAALRGQIRATTDGVSLRPLGDALAILGKNMDATAAAQELPPLLAQIFDATDPVMLDTLASAFNSLAPKADAVGTADAIALLHGKIREIGGLAAPALETSLLIMTSRLVGPAAENEYRALLIDITDANDPGSTGAFLASLTALAPRLGADAVSDGVRSLLSKIKRTDDPHSLKILGQGLASMARERDGRGVAKALAALQLKAGKRQDDEAFAQLVSGITALTERLGAAAAAESFAAISGRMNEVRDFGSAAELGASLSKLVNMLDPVVAPEKFAALLEQYRGTMDGDSGDFHASALVLGCGLASLAIRLEPAAAAKQIPVVRALILSTSNPDFIAPLHDVLVALAINLDSGAAEREFVAMRSDVETTADISALYALGGGLFSLATKFDAAAAREAFGALRLQIDEAKDQHAVAALATSFAALALKLDADAATDAATVLCREIRVAKAADVLNILGRSLGAVTMHARPEAAQEAQSTALSVMARFADAADSYADLLSIAARSMPFEDFSALIIEALKYPTVAETATQTLLTALKSQPGSTADFDPSNGLWAAVAWAEGRGGYDLIDPPALPMFPQSVAD